MPIIPRRPPWDEDAPPYVRPAAVVHADPDTDPWGVVEQPVTRHPLGETVSEALDGCQVALSASAEQLRTTVDEAARLFRAPISEAQEALRRDYIERLRDEVFIAPPVTITAAAEPHTPTAGERTLAGQLDDTGWADVTITPPRGRRHDVPDSIEVRAVDPDGAWRIVADGGSDGVLEGYTVTRIDDGEESERIRSPRVPTPNEAVGQWEAQRRTAMEAERPRGRKG